MPAPHVASNVIGSLRTIETREADTLLDVAYENDLGFVELVAANPGVDPWLPGDGTRVVLPGQHILPNAPREGIVINLAEMRLYYFPPKGGTVRTYPVGIGRRGLSTPTGTTEISAKVPKPTWYPTARMRREDPSLPAAVPAGPENPLGDYALDLGWSAYLIHGTNKKWGIGRRISSGCIRLYPAHIEDLFNRVTTGTKVTVVDQPIKFAWADGELYVEAHTTQTQAEALEQTGAFQPDPDLNLTELARKALGDRRVAIDLTRLETAVARRRGLPVRITQRGAS
jgi:L,D-transpeptidase ErfK/SrfK